MSGLNPFRPGSGGTPPYLAGREREQTLFRGLFEMLRGGSPLGQPVVLYGPRGNGKTALLAWVEEQVEADEDLDGIWLTPTDVSGPEELAPRLQLESWMRRITPENISVAGVGVGLRKSARPPLLAKALEARSKDRPFVLLLDEAHTLDAEVARALLNAAQTAWRRSPFLLVLAGTPDLEARLSGIGASFWNRADIHPLGRLNPEAAAEAIRQPLAAGGAAIEPVALNRIVSESHGYPFFLQLWGRAVWERAHCSTDSEPRVTEEAVDEAAAEFETKRDRYYRQRFNELDEADLLPAAREVALSFRSGERLSHADFREAVRRGTAAAGAGGDEKAAARALQHLGLVWQTDDGAPAWEPGIPSLVDYLLKYMPETSA